MRVIISLINKWYNIGEVKLGDLTVIIPSYNGSELLDICLTSLYKQEIVPNEIIVINNGSEDETESFLKKKYPEVRIISFSENQGFAEAVNMGIKNAKFEKIFILNNDTKLDKECLKYLLRDLEKDYRLDAVAPLIFLSNNKVDSSGSFINELGQAFHDRGRVKKNQNKEIFLITAAAVLIRKNIFKKVGMFEEKFFAYGEDVDWSFRAQLAGCSFICDQRAVVYHEHKATSSRNPQFLEYLQFRNAYLFILRCFPLKTLLKRGRLFGIFLTNINTFFYLLFKGFILEAIKAELWLILNLPWILRERLKIQKNRKVNLEYIDNNLKPKEIRLLKLLK